MIDPAFEAAVRLVYAYVKRGDSIESLKRGAMGFYDPDGMGAQIGGFLNGKLYNSDWIVVHRDVRGRKSDKAFKLKDVIKQIQSKQLSLFGSIDKA